MNRINSFLFLLLFLFCFLTSLIVVDKTRSELISHGPIFSLGFSTKPFDFSKTAPRRHPDMQIETYSLGWRFGFNSPEWMQEWGQKINSNILVILEPIFGFIIGDEDAVEVAGVPMLRLEYGSSNWVVPFIEGGLGFAYSELKTFRLGSSFLFLEQAGVGISLPGLSSGRWSLGYRFRHVSHARLFDGINSGLDTHFVTLSYDFPE